MGFIRCNLRVLMAEHYYNIQDVKDRTKLSRTTISNLANNNATGVQYDTMVQLCEFFSCLPGDLFSYVDTSIDFEDITEEEERNIDMNEDTFIADEDGNGEDYISSINTECKICANIRYKNEQNKIIFNMSIEYRLNEDKDITEVSAKISDNFIHELSRINIPWYVKKYAKEKLSEFIMSFGFDTFSEEIEGESLGGIYIDFSNGNKERF